MLTLREEEAPRRQFDIFIGAPEAASISMALEDEVTPRPLTHDLFVLALERLSISVIRVVLTHVSEGTYFAELVLGSDAASAEHVVSCRPSDGVAIALRAHCPIYATDELLDAVAAVVEEETAVQADEILDEFRDFIENISPEDFSD